MEKNHLFCPFFNKRRLEILKKSYHREMAYCLKFIFSFLNNARNFIIHDKVKCHKPILADIWKATCTRIQNYPWQRDYLQSWELKWGQILIKSTVHHLVLNFNVIRICMPSNLFYIAIYLWIVVAYSLAHSTTINRGSYYWKTILSTITGISLGREGSNIGH